MSISAGDPFRPFVPPSPRAAVRRTLNALLGTTAPVATWSSPTAGEWRTARVVWWTRRESGVGASTAAHYLASVWSRTAVSGPGVVRVETHGMADEEAELAPPARLYGRVLELLGTCIPGASGARRRAAAPWSRDREEWDLGRRLWANEVGLLVVDDADRLGPTGVRAIIRVAAGAAREASVAVLLVAGARAPATPPERAGRGVACPEESVELEPWTAADVAAVLGANPAPVGAVNWAAPAYHDALALVHGRTEGVACAVAVAAARLAHALPVQTPGTAPSAGALAPDVVRQVVERVVAPRRRDDPDGDDWRPRS